MTEMLRSPVFLSLAAGVLIVLGTTMARCWVSVRNATLEAELKRDMIERGIWMAAIGGLLFAVGAWFFEGIFAGEPRPQGIDWWPVGLIVIGGIVLAGAFLRPRDPEAVNTPRPPAPPASSATQ